MRTRMTIAAIALLTALATTARAQEASTAQLLQGTWKLTGIGGPSTALLQPVVRMTISTEPEHRSLRLVLVRDIFSGEATETFTEGLLLTPDSPDRGSIKTLRADGPLAGQPEEFFFRDLAQGQPITFEAFCGVYRAERVPEPRPATADNYRQCLQGTFSLQPVDQTAGGRTATRLQVLGHGGQTLLLTYIDDATGQADTLRYYGWNIRPLAQSRITRGYLSATRTKGEGAHEQMNFRYADLTDQGFKITLHDGAVYQARREADDEAEGQ